MSDERPAPSPGDRSFRTALSLPQPDGLSPRRFPVRRSATQFQGRVIAVRTDDVVMPIGSAAESVVGRDVVAHPGAVGVVALEMPAADGSATSSQPDPLVVLVRQFRHPVRRGLLELPAGLLDVDREPLVDAAARELAEEVGLAAQRWDTLLDAYTSPGMTDEAIRIFLARGLTPVPQPPGEHEEATMECYRVPLAEAVAAVLDGRITNAMACLGLLAAERWWRHGSALRPVDAPWLRETG